MALTHNPAVAMPTRIEDQSLTGGEFAAFLRHFKTTLPADSPLADLASAPIDHPSLSALKNRGLLESAWGEAAGLLDTAVPAAIIRRAYVDSQTETAFYLQSGAGRSGLLATRLDGGCRLLFPVRTQDAMAHVIDPLDPIGAAPAALFDHTFSAAALSALVAAADQLRALFAASLLERRALDIIALRVSDLTDQFALGANIADNRSLVRLFGAMLQGASAAPADDLQIGLFELSTMGLLQDIAGMPGLLMPQPELVALAYNLLSPLPAVTLHVGAAATTAPLILIRGASLWRLAVIEDGRFHLHGIDALTAISQVMDVFDTAAKTTSETEVLIRTEGCSTCGAPARAGARFCAKCGAAFSA